MSQVSVPDPPRMGRFYRVCWWAARAVARGYFRCQVTDEHHVPRSGPVILAANHVSFGDPPLIGCMLPRPIHFLARNTLFPVPVLGWWIRQLNAVPVDREGGGAGLKAILDRLHDGAGIVLFPEGTRSSDGRIQRGRAGIGLTVIKSEAPVVPVRIFGMFEAWGRTRVVPRPGRARLRFGTPMTFTALRTEARTCDKGRLKAIYQEVADEIMQAIERLD